MKYTRPRGTQDIIPPDIETWRYVEDVFYHTFDRFGYRGIRTPIFEPTDLFVRAVGEETDIISKEMYTFVDRGGRSLTLRPENTASVIRAYLENGMHRWGGIQRLYYLGPMFRYDRPQAGRYRQFHQVGAEAIGSGSPAIDVEVIQLVVESFRALGFDQVEIRLNSVGSLKSREPYRRVLLEAIEGCSQELSGDALERYRKNPLRIFDSKDYGDKLKRRLPVVIDHLVEEDRKHFERVKQLLVATDMPFVEDPYLVRGLDYYTRTVFEVYHQEHGAQSALCGGGRYDDLVEQCGGPPTPAIGFSIGLERVIASLPEDGAARRDTGEKIEYYIVCADGEAAARALRAATVLRRFGNAEVDLSGRSVKKQLQVAADKRAVHAVIVASDRQDAVVCKRLAGRTETVVADDSLGAFAENQLSQGRQEG